MKLAEISVPFPEYRIESDVTYHTERRPTVFERMVLRLCDPGLHLPNKQNLSLLGIFRDQLGAGDVRELLESCISELTTLGALPECHALDMPDAPLTELGLTADGLQFLRIDRLPGRSRTIKVSHNYDPVSDQIEQIRTDGRLQSQSGKSCVSNADRYLRPQNPLAQVERAMALETYDWKNPATVIDHIKPVVSLARWDERQFEIACSEDGVLSVSAPHDAALQHWMDHAQSELAWEILLADGMTGETGSVLPTINTSVLRDARAARPAAAAYGKTVTERLRIVAQSLTAADAATPTIVLSSEVSVPELVADTKQSTACTLLMPTPAGMMTGFRSLSLLQSETMSVHAEATGNFRLYWAGQPRLCGLTIILNDQTATALWATLRRDFEQACKQSADSRIVFMPIAWRDVDAIREIVGPWLSMRAEQSLGGLMAVAENAMKAIAMWWPDRNDWQSAWEACLGTSIDKSLQHTPVQLDPEEVISLLIQMGQGLSANKALPLQSALLHHAASIPTLELLAKFRSVLPSTIEIPNELLGVELRQVWLEHILERKEIKFYGPHVLVPHLQNIQKAIHDIYRDIGEQALKAACHGQTDVRTLTPNALNAMRAWRKITDDFHSLNVSSPHWEALNDAIESWSQQAQKKLAPVASGRRIVVPDTSALIEHCELLQELHPNDILVVPQRVMSDLDRLKTAESLRACTAVQQLDASAFRIQNEEECAGLLPAECDTTQLGNAVLSTALFFRLNDVLLISSDINQQQAAQSSGLKTQDPKSYMRSRPFPAAASALQPRKQNKRKKKRK